MMAVLKAVLRVSVLRSMLCNFSAVAYGSENGKLRTEN
jgi:hypothetical protein